MCAATTDEAVAVCSMYPVSLVICRLLLSGGSAQSLMNSLAQGLEFNTVPHGTSGGLTRRVAAGRHKEQRMLPDSRMHVLQEASVVDFVTPTSLPPPVVVLAHPHVDCDAGVQKMNLSIRGDVNASLFKAPSNACEKVFGRATFDVCSLSCSRGSPRALPELGCS